MPALNRATRGTSKVGATLIALLLVAMLFPGAALAANAITPVTGGGAILADTGPAPTGTAAWTALGGPVVAEGSPADILATGTVTLTLAGSFEFRTVALGGAVGAAFTASAGTCNLTVTTPVVTATTIETTLGGTASTGSDRCRLTFSGIQVRPTTGITPNTAALAFSGAVTGAAGTLTMVPGAPIVAFTTQPSSTATAGIAFPQQPIVTSVDRFDNVRGSDAISLAITAGAGAPGAALTCTTNPVTTNSSGLATFAGCKIDKSSPIAYTLRATSSEGGTSATSSAISITPGAATKLVFTAQPARGTPGGSFAVQPVVTIQDANDNVVTTASASVTLAIGTNPGGAGTNLLCTTNPLATTNGVASFSGCRINNVGVGYTLTANDGGALFDPTSALFDVADRVVFATQPSSAVTAGVAFITQPIVHVRAGASNTATHDSATSVTLSLKSGTGATGATLTCDSGLSRTVAAGIATFAGCKIDKVSSVFPSNPYVIVASASNLSSAESTTVAVSPGAAAKLGFTAQPGASTGSTAFTIQPVVAIQDAGGNTVTTASATTITLAIGTNPGGGTLTCTGGLSKGTVSGVATFGGCQINNAGVGYTITADDGIGGFAAITSGAFNVTAPTATLTLSSDLSITTYRQFINLGAQFSGTGGANRLVTFQGMTALLPATWVTIGTATSNAAGRASFSYGPPYNTQFRAVFAGTPDLAAVTSNTITVNVRHKVTLRPGAGTTTFVRPGTRITYTATVRPIAPAGLQRVTFLIYKRVGGVWTLRTSATVPTSSGVASFSWRWSSGQWYVRARGNATIYNLAALSALSRVTAR